MKLLYKISEFCNAGVCLEINPHKDIYETIRMYLFDKEIPEAIYKKIIHEDRLVVLRAYPSTPITYHEVVGYDINMVIKNMAKILGV